uniref:Uncharacterized protein n=1 Tax=Tanacetum cinerariifolium TaxID=118510 RepID=A0A699I8T3_TANCI|nr:hypothetical protein [Tanacetum cinerariifolium]
MDPNSSLGKICLGENVVEISSDKIEGSRDWDSPEYQDTTNSGGKNETKAMIFHKMDTKEVSDRFVAPCFVNGLEAYDGEINLIVEENMFSNEYVVKLCLKHEVKRGNKIVKKELIVALRGEIYFVEFIINPDEDDVEPGEIFKRSFQTKEALALRISQKFSLLEQVRPVLETMAYHDTYKKVGVTTLIAKFLILDIPIDRDALIVVGQGFQRTIGGIVNTLERLFLTFDGFCHQTFRTVRVDVMRNQESDNDNEEEYEIKRNNFGASIYGPKPTPYLNCNDPAER